MSRFLITADKGVLRICEKEEGRIVRTRSLRIEASGEEIRAEAVRMIRSLYVIISRRSEAGESFGVDDVVADFRRAVGGDAPVAELAGGDFPLRADLVSVGKEFKGDFCFVYPMWDVSYGKLIEYIASLVQVARNEGKESRVRSYSSTRRSLSKFLGNGDVTFDEVDRDFVSDYSDWLCDEGVAASTQSFYLRTLRAILNQARVDGVFEKEDNLFAGMNTRVVFSGVGAAPAVLSRELMWKIASADLSDDEVVCVVRDMFMFAFYCKGMELTDVLNLRRSDVHESILTFKRRGNGRLKSMILDGNAMEILDRYSDGEGEFIFPLRSMYPGVQQYSLNGVVRRALKRIGEAVDAPQLSFGMNISTWQSLISGMDAAEILRGSA